MTAWAGLALLLLASPCFADQVDDILTVGRKAFADGEYSLAVKSFQRVSAEFPESARAEEAGYLLGVSLFYAGRWAETLTTFETFRSRYAHSSFMPRTSYWMAAASLKLGKNDQALGYLTAAPAQSAEGNPYQRAGMLLAGAALEALGRDADAASSYRKLLADPGAGALAAEATFRLAGTEYRAGRFASARDLYSKVLIDSPASPFVRDSVFFLAECELSLGNLTEAEKRYRTLLSLYPDSPYREAATFRLADVAWRQKKQAAALDQLDALQKQFADGAYRGSALRLRADILYDQQKYDQALTAYARVLGMLPDGGEKQSVHYSIGLAELAMGRKQEAADAFAMASAGASPEVAGKAMFQRAVLLAGVGKEQESMAILDEFLRACPGAENAEEAQRLLASLLEKQGNHQAAMERWDSLVRDFPGSAALPEYLFRRGSALFSLGNSAAALDDFNRVLKEFPRSRWRAESSYAIGYAYTQRGEYPRALPFFQSVAQDPSAGEVGERSQLSYAICLFNMARFDKALASFQSLLARKPKTVAGGTIALYIGRTFYRMEKLDEAARQLAAAARMLAADGSPEAADAQYWMAWSYLRLGRLVEARDAFLAMAQSFPNDSRRVETFFRAGICETMRNDDGSAVKLFGAVISSPRTSAGDEIREQALYEQGWALARLGRQQESADAFEELAREYPAGRMAPQAFFKLAEISLDARRYEDASAGFQRVARDFSKSALAVQALYWSAEARSRSGDVRGAVDGFWACLSAGPASGLLASAIDGFSASMHSTGSLDLARQYSVKARAESGLPPEARAGILLAYADMLLASAPADALSLINEASRAAPPEPYAGQASLLLGRYYAAVSDWSRCLDILGALEGSRADEVGAEAALARGRALEAMGRTADAVEEFLKVSYLFPDYSDLAAEGLYNAARVARARGDKDAAAKIEQSLRKGFPASLWVGKLDAQ
ncbi:MAG: tetratricopeptide repeat protein [Spirochaetia bacterium]